MTYKLTKKNVLESIGISERFDGRKPFDFRDVKVKFNISKNAEASVMVTVGKTQVVAGVKMGLATPYPDHEKEGALTTSMDLLPLSSPVFEYGPPTIEAIEIARVVDRGIRESRFIDFEKLCIKEGEKVWNIYVDMATINDDGNLIDVSALAAVFALMTAKMPVYNEKTEKIESGNFTDKGLPLREENLPITITFFKIGDKIFVDPVREEDDAADGRLTIEMFGGKEEMITAMQKGGEATMTIEEIETILGEAVKIFKKLKKLVDEELKSAKKKK